MEDKPTIMVVDDSEMSRNTLRGFFTEVGCDVLSIESAEGAWMALCAGRKVDLIVLDWHLPLGMSGPALNRKIMSDERFKKIPVVAFSSKWDKDLSQPEAKEWVASFLGSEGGRMSVNDRHEVAKLDSESDASRLPPELVISVAERLGESGKPLPRLLKDAADSLKKKGFAA